MFHVELQRGHLANPSAGRPPEQYRIAGVLLAIGVVLRAVTHPPAPTTRALAAGTLEGAFLGRAVLSSEDGVSIPGAGPVVAEVPEGPQTRRGGVDGGIRRR